MGHLPGPELRSTYPALACGFSATEPSRKASCKLGSYALNHQGSPSGKLFLVSLTFMVKLHGSFLVSQTNISWREGWSEVQVLALQPCLTLCNPVDYSRPGSSVHGVLQAKILEWVAIPFSKGSSAPKDRTQVSCMAGRFLTIWDTREGFLEVMTRLKKKWFPCRPWAIRTLQQEWASSVGFCDACRISYSIHSLLPSSDI